MTQYKEGKAAPIAAYRFFATTAGASVVGHFVDGSGGTHAGWSFDLAVPSAGDPVDLAGGTDGSGVPDGAAGAVLKAAGTVSYASGAGDLAAHPGRYDALPAEWSSLGQVAL